MTGLHVVYRSYGGENQKGRPPYYSKLLALASLIRAAAEAGRPVEIIFVNDGPIPADRLDLMTAAGEVLTLPCVGNKRSLLRSLRIPGERRWPDSDLVWFAEDDYLYRPDSLARLGGAGDAFPAADYLALYALIGDRPPEGGRAPDWLDIPADSRGVEPAELDGHRWRLALATAATFGARAGAIESDRLLFALALGTASTWDYTASLAYQGFVPFGWRRLAAEPRPFDRSLRHRGKVLAAVPARAAINLAAVRQRRRHRILLAPDPALCTHLETAHLAQGVDWTKVAADTLAWTASHHRTSLAPVR